MKRNYFTFLVLLLCASNSWSQSKLTVFFDFNQDEPNQESIKAIDYWKKSSDSVQITKIEGYCDFVDTYEYNKDLSLRRANAVLKHLQSEKTNVDNVEIVGFGENFEQSKIQEANRKVIVFYNEIKKENVAQTPIDSKLSKQITASKIGEKLKLENLNFYNHSDIVRNESRPILDDLLQIMKNNETLKIEIHGHICCMIEDSHQIALLRAKKVYNFLIQNGINKNRLHFRSFGSSKPIYPLPEKNEEERDVNRRVEIMLISK